MHFPKLSLTTIAILSRGVLSVDRPKQGVFVLSNQIYNEVGVFESLDDGSLNWKGRYSTDGVGYPYSDIPEENIDALASSNSLHYHTYGGKQLLTAANAGGPEGDPSISLMEIDPFSLELTLLSKIGLNGTFACSVAAFEDKVCAVTCAGSVTMECFRIQQDNGFALETDYLYDFGANIPTAENRTNVGPGTFGPGNILFSGDGKQVGVIMKGAPRIEEYGPEYSAPREGFVAFAVKEDGYGDPVNFDLPEGALPFAFVWRSGELDTDKQIVVIVNIAGMGNGYPECDVTEDGCISSVSTLESSISEDGEISLRAIDEVSIYAFDACWIDYRFSHFYTGNFISDTVSIGTVQRDGTLTFERNVPVGQDTLPLDVAHMGRKYDESFYIYTENQGTNEIGVHRVIENDSFGLQVQNGAPLPSGDFGLSWQGAQGLAATLLSEKELFVMYGFALPDADVEFSLETEEDSSSSRLGLSIAFVLASAAALLGLP